MAYWGEAMTYNHPVWMQQDVAAARAALAGLGPTPEARAAKSGTQRERNYLSAVEILDGDGDKAARISAMPTPWPPCTRAIRTTSTSRRSTPWLDASIWLGQMIVPELGFDQPMRFHAVNMIEPSSSILPGRSFLRYFIVTYNGPEGMFHFERPAV